MKKIIIALTVVVAMFCCMIPAFAADIMLNKEIKSIAFKKDKNGQEYARIFIVEERTLNGVAYKKDVPVMAFGDAAAAIKAKGLKKGQPLKAIAAENEYKGSKGYVILDIVR